MQVISAPLIKGVYPPLVTKPPQSRAAVGPQLLFCDHIAAVSHSGCYHLNLTKRLQTSLSDADVVTVTHAFVPQD